AVIAPTLVNIVMAIGAVANAISQITAALGYTNVSRVFRIIGALADIGNTAIQFVQAVRAAANAAAGAVAKAVIKAIQQGIALATKILDLFGVTKLSNVLKIAGAVLGFIDSKAYQRGKRSVWRYAFDLFKFARGIAANVATIAGSAAASRFINLLGVIEDVVDIYTQITTPIPPVPNVYPNSAVINRPVAGKKLWKVAVIIGRGLEVIREVVSIGDRVQRFTARR
ncbi:MAG TPA: hypothetical protein VK400_06800, partial [Pyrinomonadaceae bacterium]|nr:hypothetical protein [Pyrinomonadaceae bacterium]